MAGLPCDGGGMLRFLLLRFLPRRLFPLLVLFELFRLFRRWRSRDDASAEPPNGGPGTPKHGSSPAA